MAQHTEKPANESSVERVEMVLPNDANPLGNILGGRVMHLIDITAAIAKAGGIPLVVSGGGPMVREVEKPRAPAWRPCFTSSNRLDWMRTRSSFSPATMDPVCRGRAGATVT